MKRIFCVVLSFIIVLGMCYTCFAATDVLLIASNPGGLSFSDVNRDTIQGQAIYKLAEAGILLGDGDGKFRPYDPITRGELSKIVNAIFGYTEKADSGFADMKGDEWFYPYVLVAKKAGYIIGYDDGTFRADDHVSREQACVILCRVAGLYDLGLSFAISDPVAEWALPYVQKVLGNGLMALEEGNTFRATQNITREEFSTVFAHFLKPAPVLPTTPVTPVVPGGSISTGGDDKDEKPDYSSINKKVVEKLNAVSTDIGKNINRFTSKNSQQILTIVNTCIKDAVKQKSKVKIDSDFIEKEYASEISQVESLYEEVKEDDIEEALFQQEITTNLSTATINWLLNEFGLSKYLL